MTRLADYPLDLAIRILPTQVRRRYVAEFDADQLIGWVLLRDNAIGMVVRVLVADGMAQFRCPGVVAVAQMRRHQRPYRRARRPVRPGRGPRRRPGQPRTPRSGSRDCRSPNR